MLHHWLDARDGSGSHVRVALLDYKKAFNLVDHWNYLLIAKLYSIGVKPNVVNWICDFLRNRSQHVKLDSSCFSEFVNVPAGIPQGTKISPWLFLAMINDLSTTPAPCGSLPMIPHLLKLYLSQAQVPCKIQWMECSNGWMKMHST